MKRRTGLDVYFNSKTKLYTDGTINSTCCKSYVFKSSFDESEEHTKNDVLKQQLCEERTQNILDYLEVRQTMDLTGFQELRKERLKELPKKEREIKPPRYDSLKRAKDSIFDYVLNNDFDYFFTGTINPDTLNSKEPKELLLPLQKWLQNMVQRYDMQYIMIAEYHKRSGRIHFHGLFKADKLRLLDSGTKLYKGYNKPVSNERAVKLGLENGRTVYNLATWKFGFSTCIELYGDRINTAFYITKYITKDCKKIFGKFFWHNRALKKPVIQYSNMLFEEIDSIDYNGYKYIFKTGDENEALGDKHSIQLHIQQPPEA